MNEISAALKKMREPFPANLISKMCRSTKKDNQKGPCKKCGGFHGLPAITLDYVGHAALTDRLLEADPLWTWEPLAVDQSGYPAIDGNGGMWIKLTVGGVTRLGYGDAQGKQGGDAMKERIGDALRNAAMRFGAALDLWHKGDLHGDDGPVDQVDPNKSTDSTPPPKVTSKPTTLDLIEKRIDSFATKTEQELTAWYLDDENLKLIEAKSSLSAEELSKANKYFAQMKDTLKKRKPTTAQRQGAPTAQAGDFF